MQCEKQFPWKCSSSALVLTASVPWTAFDTHVYKIQITIRQWYGRWPGISVLRHDRYCLEMSVLEEPEDTSVFFIRPTAFFSFPLFCLCNHTAFCTSRCHGNITFYTWAQNFQLAVKLQLLCQKYPPRASNRGRPRSQTQGVARTDGGAETFPQARWFVWTFCL